MSAIRIWYPFTFTSPTGQVYGVSFRIAEEATWDHRYHALEGGELSATELGLRVSDISRIQASCDAAVGTVDVSAPQAALNAPACEHAAATF
jgi:hypothetical protein